MIDSHVHPVFGAWTPRQNQIGWIDSTINGGVTTLISAGKVHLPGRPKDIVGLKALAITAQRAFHNSHPAGVKLLAGAPVIEKGMVESGFAELAHAGVSLLGEVGLGAVKAVYAHGWPFNLPGVGMVMLDSIVRCHHSRNTPPATEVPAIVSV